MTLPYRYACLDQPHPIPPLAHPRVLARRYDDGDTRRAQFLTVENCFPAEINRSRGAGTFVPGRGTNKRRCFSSKTRRLFSKTRRLFSKTRRLLCQTQSLLFIDRHFSVCLIAGCPRARIRNSCYSYFSCGTSCTSCTPQSPCWVQEVQEVQHISCV